MFHFAAELEITNRLMARTFDVEVELGVVRQDEMSLETPDLLEVRVLEGQNSKVTKNIRSIRWFWRWTIIGGWRRRSAGRRDVIHFGRNNRFLNNSILLY